MRANPEPDESLRHAGRDGAMVVANTRRPRVWTNCLEVETWVAGVVFPEPVVLEGQAADCQGQGPIVAPKLGRCEAPHGSGWQRPALKSSIAFLAKRSSGPPDRASSSIWASQSAWQRRSSSSLSRQSSCRGSLERAASISVTVLMSLDYLSRFESSTRLR